MAYARDLSQRLRVDRVEHKIVTYQFRYRTGLREEAIGTRTAVVYRDVAHPSYPWWIMDERLHKPVWLPNTDLQQQVAFYLHHPVESVETVEQFGEGGHKRMLGVSPAASDHRLTQRQQVEPRGLARLFLRRSSDRALRADTLASRSAEAPNATSTDRAERRTFWLKPRRSTAAAPAFVATSGASNESIFAQLFRSKHGTDFDRSSSVDRRKMEQLRLSALRRGGANARAF